MKSSCLPLLGVSALLVALALPAESEAQQKTPPQKTDKPKPPPKPPQPKPDFEEAESLKQAYLLILGSNHNYDGHRGKALNQVKDAFKVLDGHVAKGGTPQQKAAIAKEAAAIAQAEKAAKDAPAEHESQPVSDAQLIHAKQLLTQVGAALAKNKQNNVLNHVNKAVEEINASLTVSANKAKADVQFAEAESLRRAYVLLLEGNADYDGHRVKAMHAVKGAFKALDAHVLASGSDKEKAAIKKESTAIAEAEKARNNAGVIQENQLRSDALLAGARESLAELRPTLAKNKQNKVLEHVDAAVKEIGIALSIR